MTKKITRKRGCLIGQGPSASEAKADLEHQIDWALENTRLIIEHRFGFILVLAESAAGITTAMVDPTNGGKGRLHGTQHHCQTFHGQVDSVAVMRSLRINAAQNDWGMGHDDDAFDEPDEGHTMKRIEIDIETDTKAFHGGGNIEAVEIARILRGLIAKIEDDDEWRKLVQRGITNLGDSSGAKVGVIKVIKR